jgi:hypothetical protein
VLYYLMMSPWFDRSRRRSAVLARTRLPATEPLESRRLMRGDFGEFDEKTGRSSLRAALNPAGAVFIDAGNLAGFLDVAGTTTWSPDGQVSGGKRLRGKFAVAGTEDDALFISRRTGKQFAYTIAAADGQYTLSLLFVDTLKRAGKRLFNVDAEGQRIESNLDIFSRAGAARTSLVTTHVLTVTGGTFDLALAGVKGQAVLSGFSLVPIVSAEQPPASTLPAPPTNLTSVSESPTSVSLSWADNSNDENRFLLDRSTNGSAFATVTTLPAGSASYRDDTAVPGTAYIYRVRATNAAGASAPSNESAVTTSGAATPPPAAPTGLAAVVISGAEIQLSWTDNSGDETSFVLERSANGGAFTPLANTVANSTQYADTAVSLGATYVYRVHATNSAGASGSSQSAEVSTPLPPTPEPPAPPTGTAPAPTGLTAIAATATTLDLAWDATDASEGITKYRISYAPGEYEAGPAGQWQTIEVPATATSVQLPGLLSFALYSIDVSAVRADGVGTAAHLNTWTAKPAGMSRYLYLFDAPKDVQGFENLKPQIEVFDIENNHQWVKNIPLPSDIFNIRGVAASVETGKLYVSFFLTAPNGYQPGGLLCLDINTNELIWRKDYPSSVVPSPDRFDITPDGKKIYLPVGEHGPDRFWSVIDASNGDVLGRIFHTTAPHNTIVSLDGKYAFLEGQEKGTQPDDVLHTIGVVDTTTDQVVRKIGPFKDIVRPFTINGSGTLAFATMNNFIGFQVGDIRTGEVLFTAPVPNRTQPGPDFNGVINHGIGMTPDEKEIWLVDTAKVGIHVFDVSGVKNGIAPTYVKFIQTRRPGKDLTGNTDPNASRDAGGVPAWLNRSHDGKYVYAELGEIIDVASKTIIGQLRGKELNSAGQLVDAPYSHSRFMMEIDVVGGQAVRATDQFGVGLVR